MFSQGRIYFIVGLILIFSGCTLTNTNKSLEKKQTEIKKNQVEKKVFKYKYCDRHISIMKHASQYIEEEFNKGYFLQKDILGAKAQIFLVESNSKSIFARNINSAIKSYNKQYLLAKKNKCNLNNFRISPLEKVKLKIKKLENNISKKEDKK